MQETIGVLFEAMDTHTMQCVFDYINIRSNLDSKVYSYELKIIMHHTLLITDQYNQAIQ